MAILLLLQRHGTVTASQVAEELEVSERTARRDLEALGVAGLPVYPSRGRGGGWRLAGGGKTDLSGLSEREVRALFVLAGPRSAADPQLRSALRKLVRALPEPFHPHVDALTTRMLSEAGGWSATPPPERPQPDHLDAVQDAVVKGDVLTIGYVRRDRASSVREVHPLGLVMKGTIWYLIADTADGLRTFRVDRISAADRTGGKAVTPDGFRLDEAWQTIADEIRQRRLPYRVHALVEREWLGVVRYVFGDAISIGTAAGDDHVHVELRDESALVLASKVAGFGRWIVVDEDQAVRSELRRIADELTTVYSS